MGEYVTIERHAVKSVYNILTHVSPTTITYYY